MVFRNSQKFKLPIILKWALGFILAFSFSSCVLRTQRKTADYYKQNQVKVHETVDLYNKLYAHQPFSIGFTDKTYQYYVIEISTDTLKEIYNNEDSQEKMFEAIKKYKYNITELLLLAKNMKELSCLWLDKITFYEDEKANIATFLSFKSATVDRPFVENKYYVLAFTNKPLKPERIKKSSLQPVAENVYFTIMNKFR